MFIDFLKQRRSVTAKKMAPGEVTRKHLQKILEVGLRVPDHGALKPWRLVVITGEKRKIIDNYSFNGFWLDMGRPEDYDRINNEFSKLSKKLKIDKLLKKYE